MHSVYHVTRGDSNLVLSLLDQMADLYVEVYAEPLWCCTSPAPIRATTDLPATQPCAEDRQRGDARGRGTQDGVAEPYRYRAGRDEHRQLLRRHAALRPDHEHDLGSRRKLHSGQPRRRLLVQHEGDPGSERA